MIFEVKITEQADFDLRGIYEYIAFRLQSVDNAVGQLARIESCIMSLKQMPERFRKYESEPWHSRGLHIMPVDNYCVMYIPDTEKYLVTIIRVMYNGRDIETQLKNYTQI